jgi:hypothetical protein
MTEKEDRFHTIKLLLGIWMCLTVSILSTSASFAQKFFPDDPVWKDPDNLSIEKPTYFEVSPTYDMVFHSFVVDGKGPALHSLNTNTLGEVPDSSWFTNRIGQREMSPEELMRGSDSISYPDMSGDLSIVGGGLSSITEGLIVRDSRGEKFYLVFDPKGLPNLATGAAVISAKFFHAFGYNVPAASLHRIESSQLILSPYAELEMLGGKLKPLDDEYVRLFLEEQSLTPDGKYRVAAFRYPPGEPVGMFRFFGIRGDDPNDVFNHEDRRELRGLRLFAAWLNHYLCRSVVTTDYFIVEDGNSFLKHYLVDFTTTLGSGYDLDFNIVPKPRRAGNEYTLRGDTPSFLKTALSLGIWERDWMKIDYPYPEYAEIGRIEGDYFDPTKWKTDYPNPAFERMLPDDAFWAARIISRFSDEMIRSIVSTAEYIDPKAEGYLVETLIKRRDKILQHYFKEINPLDGFQIQGEHLNFTNLGEEWGLAADSVYEYEWSVFDNKIIDSYPITDRMMTREKVLKIPRSSRDFLMVRIRTHSESVPAWKKNVDVYLRMNPDPQVVGIEREVEN